MPRLSELEDRLQNLHYATTYLDAALVDPNPIVFALAKRNVHEAASVHVSQATGTKLRSDES